MLITGGGCAPAQRARPVSLPAAVVESSPNFALKEVIRSAPILKWHSSTFGPKSKYLYFPEDEFGPGFYLTENGFRILEPDNFALRYDKTDEGFRMIEIKKRQGITHLPECPVFLPADRCVEDHALMLATVVRCSESCTYRFVVFDYFDPVFVLRSNPTMIGVMRNLIDGTPTRIPFEIKHEEYGDIPKDHQEWTSFIQARLNFIREKIRKCEKEYDLKFVNQ